jgi:hypothetical protein
VGAASWTDPDFIAEAHAWLIATCGRLGIGVSGAIEQPHVRPWSTVFRARTSTEAVYLKCCGASQAHEPQLTALLTRKVPDLLPELLALHPSERWMLVAEGGAKLREAVSGDALLAEWRAILPRYARTQRMLAPHVDEMLAFGTPDFRLVRLVPALARVLDDDSVLGLGHPDGLTFEDRARLRALLPTIEERCRELAALGVPETVQHDDLHDGNVLIGRERRVVFDWGDACVTHPFLSLTVALRAAAHTAKREEDAPEILALRDAYLEPWTDLAPLARLREHADLARRIGNVTRALTWYRVVTEFPEVLAHETVSHSLGRVLTAFDG